MIRIWIIYNIEEADFRMEIEERLVQGMKQLKTQRLLPIVNHTFLIADSTSSLYSEQKKNVIFLPTAVSKMLGIKDKGGLTTAKSKRSLLETVVPYLLLVLGVCFASLYPILLNSMSGNIYERIYGRYLMNGIMLVPIVIVELHRKMRHDAFSLKGALNSTTLIINYKNSVFLTSWSLFMGLSLQYTEISSTLFFSNLMLLVWVLRKIFRRSSGISESEVNGSVLLLAGTLIFALKQGLTEVSLDKTTSLFSSPSFIGAGLALLASLCAEFFFTSNYELAYYLPSYTSLLLITGFSLLNLECIHFLLSLVFPSTHTGLLSLKTIALLLSSHTETLHFTVFGGMTLFTTFSLQHYLLTLFDSFIVSLAFQWEPFVSLLVCMWYGIQTWEYSSLLFYCVFLVGSNLLIVAGIRQFEDKYEGGILGMSNDERNEVRIEHLRELQLLGVGDLSDTHSKQ